MRLFLKICLVVLGILFLNSYAMGIIQGQPEAVDVDPNLKDPNRGPAMIKAKPAVSAEAVKEPDQPKADLAKAETIPAVVNQVQQTEKKSAAGSPEVAPIINITPLEGKDKLYSFELREVEIGDLFRVLAQDYKLNLLVNEGIKGKVTASLSNVSLEEALATIAESQNLILKKKGNIIRVIPNLITKTLNLQYVEAKKLLETPTTTTGQAGQQTQSMSTIYDLLSKEGKIFLGNQPNSIMVEDYPENIRKIEEFVKVFDQRMATKVFKLKYLKAADVIGSSSTTTTTTQTSSVGGTTTQTTTTQGATK